MLEFFDSLSDRTLIWIVLGIVVVILLIFGSFTFGSYVVYNQYAPTISNTLTTVNDFQNNYYPSIVANISDFETNYLPTLKTTFTTINEQLPAFQNVLTEIQMLLPTIQNGLPQIQALIAQAPSIQSNIQQIANAAARIQQIANYFG